MTDILAIAVCIGCGCDDFHACSGGCTWLRADFAQGLGVCSNCPQSEARFDAGERDLSEQARRQVHVRAVYERRQARNRAYYAANKDKWRTKYGPGKRRRRKERAAQ